MPPSSVGRGTGLHLRRPYQLQQEPGPSLRQHHLREQEGPEEDPPPGHRGHLP